MLRSVVCYAQCDQRFLTCFFFNDTATTEIFTLSLHDALPISARLPRDRHPQVGDAEGRAAVRQGRAESRLSAPPVPRRHARRSEEHTSELQSRQYLVCRLLLEKKKSNFSSPLFYLTNNIVVI